MDISVPPALDTFAAKTPALSFVESPLITMLVPPFAANVPRAYTP